MQKYIKQIALLLLTFGVHAEDLSLSMRSLGVALEQLQALLPATEKVAGQPQPMPIASRWQLVAGKKENINRKSLENAFLKDVERDKKYNKHIPEKSDAVVRIMSFNVHFWEPLRFYAEKFQQIFDTLKPDLVVLQEVLEDPAVKNQQFQGYEVLQACNTMKSLWFGNVILGRSATKMSSVGANTGLWSVSGTPGSKTFEFQNETYGEARCFSYVDIKLKNKKTFTLYGTHLEINGSVIRAKQIAELIDEIKKSNETNALIAADFNATREKNYARRDVNGNLLLALVKEYQGRRDLDLQTIQALMDEGYESSFEKIEWPLPTYTVWSGIAVDYIFTTPKWNIPIAGSYIYYTDASDHLPLYSI